jgi:TonB family protein
MKTLPIALTAMSMIAAVTFAQEPTATSKEYMSVCGVQPCAEPAKVLKSAFPKYSKEAKAKKIQGVVVVKVLIGLDGRAKDIVVVSGPGYGLEAQAVKTIKDEWTFGPCTYHGAPVIAWQHVQVNFCLFDDRQI